MFQMVLALELPEKMDDVEDVILDWESATKEYEDQSGLELPQQILRGILVRQLPDIVKTQVQLNASQLPTYGDVRKYVLDYIAAKKVREKPASKKNQDAMEVDALWWSPKGGDKGKGKGKGKGDGKGKGKWNGGDGAMQSWSFGGQ